MTHPEKSHTQEHMRRSSQEEKRSHVSSYFLALREPTMSLACDPNTRPDVTTAAILGYN